MFKIATLSTDGTKTYMIDQNGEHVTWDTMQQAETQIDLFKKTVCFNPSTPKNFAYIIEPA